MARLQDCPGRYHRQGNGEYTGDVYCPWEEIAPPEGQTRDEYHPECRANQLRHVEFARQEQEKRRLAGMCTLVGAPIHPGEPCWENPAYEDCNVGCKDYESEQQSKPEVRA